MFVSINTNMMLFKVLFWYFLLSNNFFYIDKLCQYEWFYQLVQNELLDSGFYDSTHMPSKELISSCVRNAFFNVKGLELPHYSYVYKYSKPLGENSHYFQTMKFIDKLLETCEIRITYPSDNVEKFRWQKIKEYITKSRAVLDKLDDISRPTYPLWQKRMLLQQIKQMLDDDNYDELDNFQVLPLFYFEER